MIMACQEFVTLSIPCSECGEIVKVNVRTVDYLEWTSQNRRHVQDVFPYLSAGEREMFITRICDRCFKRLVGECK